jgi:hypothetical protein
MATVTTLNNYSFAFNGFVFGGADSPYQIQSVEGLEDLPEVRVQDDNRGYFDGMFSGRDFLSGRTISMIIYTLGNEAGTAQYNFNLLQQALLPQQNGTTPMQFQLSNASGLQFINARVRHRKTAVDPEYSYGYIRSLIDFFCPDPRYYDNELQTTSMTVSPPLGRTYDRVYNLTYGGGSLTSTGLVSNLGWTTTYPTITVQGPATNPVLGNLSTGQALNFTYTMTATDSLVINLLDRTVLLNGVPARNLLSGNSQWFAAAPGTSQYYFTATNTTVGSSATVQWYNAYI